MKIRVESIKISNFRSLESVFFNLKDCTVLVGKNNCGKSNIIQAVAYGFTYANIEREDVFVSPVSPFSFDKKVTIDIKVVPIAANGNIANEFNEEWALAFGENISIDATSDKEFFAFRTEIKYDSDREQYINKKYKIDEWTDDNNIIVGDIIKRDTFDAIENVFINAQRDISIDIRDKKSIWGRLTSKIKIEDAVKTKIDIQLGKLNKQIVSKSEILTSISKELKATTADTNSDISISPLTKDIETIYSGMNIYYKTKDSVPTSVENLGLGIRSWAVFSTVKAQIVDRIKKAKKEEFAYFPMLLIEEPEAHVHPQAQRQLFSDIDGINGQKLITTHSPYILSQIDLDKILYIRKEASSTLAMPLLVDGLSSEDIRKIKRTVMNTRGEILYANAVILAEGETEEQALAVYLREYFKKEPFELGINIIGVGGSNYLPFMRVLDRLSIKWYVFSDGETEPINKLRSTLKSLHGLPSRPPLSNYPNIFALDGGNNIESYYLEQGYLPNVKKAICRIENNPDFLDNFVLEYEEKPRMDGTIRHYSLEPDGGIKSACKDLMTAKKTKYATAIAEEIVAMKPKSRRMPGKLKELFAKIKADLQI